jgi:transposase
MGVRGKKLESWEEEIICKWWMRGLSIRGIAKMLGHGRNVVRRVLRDENPKNTR